MTDLEAAVAATTTNWKMDDPFFGDDHAVLRGHDATAGLLAVVHQCANLDGRYAVDLYVPDGGRVTRSEDTASEALSAGAEALTALAHAMTETT